MASIRKEFRVPVPAEAVWAALRDFGAVDRLAAGFVASCVVQQEGAVRLVTFANGMQVHERLVTLDDAQRRLVYTTKGGRATHYNAAAQVVPEGDHACRFVWLVDLLPDALAPAIGQMMEAGARAMAATLTPRPG